ncbi:MAG: hypothetical protein MJ007_06930 [Paludibacteraceae bacterium]|nr:hypothetical protein [Paludibacteraceae bacterium]
MKRIIIVAFSMLMIVCSVYAKRYISRAESGESVSRTVISNVAVPVKQNKETANTPTSVVAKQNPRQEYAYLYSKSDFEKAQALSDADFKKDVNLRKEQKQQAEKFITTVKDRFSGDNLMSAKSSDDTKVGAFMNAYNKLADNIYISDIKHQLISSNSKMRRDYAKYSSLYSSESEFVDAYLSENFKADVRGRE